MSDRPRRERGVSLGRHMHARMYWYCMHACGKRQAALGGLMILPTSMQQVEGEWSETGSDRTVGPTFVPRCHLFRPGILGKPSLFPKLLRLLLRIYIYIYQGKGINYTSQLPDRPHLSDPLRCHQTTSNLQRRSMARPPSSSRSCSRASRTSLPTSTCVVSATRCRTR